MSAFRAIGAFILCLAAANLAFLGGILGPTLLQQKARTINWAELANAASFISAFTVPLILMGGLTFGFGFLGLARHFALSKSVVALAVFGAFAAISYAAFVMLLLSGLNDPSIWTLLVPAGVAGGVCGVLWAVLVERHANA